jgi:alginate O-acetyltransferase complex protein AlgI
VFAAPRSHDWSQVCLGVASYSGQIFCDFWGYTSIARGCSLALGYPLPQNFDHPYASASVTEFWRRWHMTLSRWLRDYLYVGLGGNRGGRLATYRNLLLTMTLGGLWHGARWTFVAWGLYHGVLLVLHKLWVGFAGDSALLAKLRATGGYRALAVAATLLLVTLGWVLFRASSLDEASTIVRLAFDTAPRGGAALEAPAFARSAKLLVVLGVVTAAGTRQLGLRFHRALSSRWRGVTWALLVGVLYLYGTSTNEFIYFYF